MRDNLGQVIQCVSHVNTRLRYVQKSMETFGSQNKVVVVETLLSQRRYVTNVSTDLNAPNGVFITNDTVSGVDLTPEIDKGFVLNVT